MNSYVILNHKIFILKGCQTIVHCASAESSTLQSGKFYRNSKVDDGIEDFLNQRYPEGDLQDEFYQMSKNAVCSWYDDSTSKK